MIHANVVAIFALLLKCGLALGQDQGDGLLAYERNIEKAVVATDLAFLGKAYADDFRFKHGTGLVDSKSSWLESVSKARGQYVSRDVDSVEVEVHGNIGITNGKITVLRKSEKISHFFIKYVRVYIWRDERWQLIMHRTVFEKRLN